MEHEGTKARISPLLARLESCPPFLVYYAVTSGHRGPMPVHLGAFRNNNPKRLHRDQMVKDSGMSSRKFYRMAQAISWLDFSVRDVFAFCRACRFDWDGVWALRRRIKKMMQEGTFRPVHLEKQQVQRFNRLAAKWAESRKAMSVQTSGAA